ncbi:TPR-2 domain protein, putative, partial [Rhizoctonia solani AG-3 Rhs1AP]
MGYQQKFEAVGGLDDIDKAISYLGRVLSLSPRRSLTIAALINLGDSHRRRYQRLNDPEDIDKATEYHNLSLAHIEASDDLRLASQSLNNLGLVHLIKYGIQREYSDIEKAIQYLSRALLSDTTRNTASRSIWLANLGIARMIRYSHLQEDDDMNEGIRAYNEALTCTSPESPVRPMVLANLGLTLWSRFQKYANDEDIQAAISSMSHGISLLPTEHPDMSKMLNTLGKICQTQAEYLDDAKSLRDSSDSFKKAAPSGFPASADETI